MQYISRIWWLNVHVVILLFFLNIFKCEARYSDEINKKISFILCSQKTLSVVQNIKEVVIYNNYPLTYKNENIIELDTIILSKTDSMILFSRYEILGTDFTLTFLVDINRMTCEILNYGYQNFQKLNLNGLNKFLEHNKDYDEALILDLLLPPFYSGYKISKGQIFHDVPRRLYNKLNVYQSNKQFLEKSKLISGWDDGYAICDYDLKTIYFVKMKENKGSHKLEFEVVYPTKVMLSEIFGFSHSTIGPEIKIKL